MSKDKFSDTLERILCGLIDKGELYYIYNHNLSLTKFLAITGNTSYNHLPSNISSHPEMTVELLEKLYLRSNELPFPHYIDNDKVTPNFIKKNRDKYPHLCSAFVNNPMFNYDIIREMYPKENPKYVEVLYKFSPKIFESIRKDFKLLSILSGNMRVDINYILSNPKYQWNYYKISQRKDFKFEHLLSAPHLNWPWILLTRTMDYQDIINHPELKWDMKHLINNPTVPLNSILQFNDKYYGAANYNLTFNYFKVKENRHYFRVHRAYLYENKFTLQKNIYSFFFNQETKIKSLIECEF